MKSPTNRGGLRFYLVIFALLTVFATPAIHTTPATVLHGVPLILLGVALHLWAKGCLHQDREVTTTGPYRFVRHPFYTANALIDSGIAVMSTHNFSNCVTGKMSSWPCPQRFFTSFSVM